MSSKSGRDNSLGTRPEPEEEALRNREYELRLIRCTFSPSPFMSPPPSSPSDQAHNLNALINHLLALIESGNYLGVFNSEASRLVFQLGDELPFSFDDSIDCADRLYSEFLKRAESFIEVNSANDTGKASRIMLVMCIAAAALLAFSQCSITGPLNGIPRCPLPLEVGKGDQYREWDSWARNQLMSAGSDLLGKFSNLQYIVFAKILLMRMKDLLSGGILSPMIELKSLSWWLARVLLLQQRILDERSSSLFDLLQVNMGEALQQFGNSEAVRSYWDSNLRAGESSAIVSMVHLEAGILEYVYGRVDSCRKHFESAEIAAGIQLSVTGVLGFRTVHQVEPKAQMVLVTNSSQSNNVDNCSSMNTGIQTYDSIRGEENLPLQQNDTNEVSDVLVVPKLLTNDKSESRLERTGNGANGTVHLTAMQQAVVLAHCLLLEKSSRHDEMQRWDMAPYIEAIDSQNLSPFTIRCFCDLLRIRWESSRSQTKERALLMMDKLVQSLYEASPAITERIPFCYDVFMPCIPALRKEYGELLVRCGLIGEAVKVFEDLELWDNLIFCYRYVTLEDLLEKKATAVELIKKCLSERPNDPTLWCSLGDATDNDACYEKALEVSNNRSARAKRSLARSAYNRGEYETSKILWESAMSMNSMYPDGWFALGAAALKARDIEKALDGFTRAVQLDPENGEAWNNIACLHMIKKRSKESFIAFKEALKFKRNSWQLWENYSHVAVDVGNISQALEGAQMVLDISNNKRVDTELLERIMGEVERRVSVSHSVSPVTPNNQHNGHRDDSESEIYEQGSDVSTEGRSRETEQLVLLLGKVLQQIVKSGSGSTADVWGLYARWHRIKGDLLMCSEALLRQVRSLQGSDTWKDRNRFEKLANASLELCKLYMEISSSTNSRKELFTAEMHLKNIIKQAQRFSDTEEFRNLQACYDEVKIKLPSFNA